MSLWINIPSCLSQSDLGFLTFATHSLHIGEDSDGLGHFLVRFVRENLSEHLEVWLKALVVHHFPGMGLAVEFFVFKETIISLLLEKDSIYNFNFS